MSVKVYLLHKSEILLHQKEMEEYLSPARAKRYSSCRSEDQSLLILGNGYLTHRCLGEEPLYDEKGMPYLVDGPYISLAHSGEYSVLAISSSPVGVDIELIKEFPLKTRAYFPKAARNEDYYAAWCKYEALAKCLGLGLRFPVTKAADLGETYTENGTTYFLSSKMHDGHMIGLASTDQEEMELMLVKF